MERKPNDFFRDAPETQYVRDTVLQSAKSGAWVKPNLVKNAAILTKDASRKGRVFSRSNQFC